MTLFFRKRRETEETFREGIAALKLALEQLAQRPQEPQRDLERDVAGRLTRQMEQLDAKVDWLQGELRKLRGKVTGGERHEDAPGPTKETDPPVYLSPAWFAQQRVKMGLPRGRNGT